MIKACFFLMLLGLVGCNSVCLQLKRGGIILMVDKCLQFNNYWEYPDSSPVFQRGIKGKPFYLRILKFSEQPQWYSVNAKTKLNGHLLDMEIYEKKDTVKHVIKRFSLGSQQPFRWRGISRTFFWWTDTYISSEVAATDLSRVSSSAAQYYQQEYFMRIRIEKPLTRNCCCPPHAAFFPYQKKEKEDE